MLVRIHTALRILLASLACCLSAHVQAANWVEGQHYMVLKPAQPVDVPAGQVEVIEIFSYGCPACNAFYPTADKIKAALPQNATLSYLPASWNQAESWPLFQRAFLAAQALNVAGKAHDAMFNAIWQTRELSVMDPKNKPTIEKVAAFYSRVAGVQPSEFLAVAKSPTIELRMRAADAQIKAYRADQTPTLIVQGKYRLTAQSAGGADQVVELVKYLVAKESK